MKLIKHILFFAIIITSFSTCKEATLNKKEATLYQCPMKCEKDKVYHEPGSCPVCKMDLRPLNTTSSKVLSNDEMSDTSIFNLTSKWNTEEGETIELKDLKGNTLVVVMVYTTCTSACPRLAADMRNIEEKIPTKYIDNVNFVLVSIDPETDTPKRLKEFAKENYMDGEQWTLLQGTESGVREFANVLAIKYKQISPLDFSHSNIISVFDPQGELVHQQEGLGVDNEETITKILATVTK
tara:strand:+ start:180 stop:896 length:717 start_codon:yes stop_codon:yes gene_type:complete